MADILRKEAIYIWYYLDVQIRQILPYWILGMLIGSAVSVFLKSWIHDAFRRLGRYRLGPAGIFIASALGIASPLCMYGTIPIAASFSKSGIEDDWLAAFMMSSILLNPQLIIYSAALGNAALSARIISCFLTGVAAGLLVRFFFKEKSFFNFEGFTEPASHDTDPHLMLRFIKNLLRNIKATGLYFLFGCLLSALFQRYVPSDLISRVLGGNKLFGIFMAATIGVPLYVCGGGTVPLLQQWLLDGMSLGSATAFMITGPATKITNLGALKIVLGARSFILYLIFVILSALLSGMLVNILL